MTTQDSELSLWFVGNRMAGRLPTLPSPCWDLSPCLVLMLGSQEVWGSWWGAVIVLECSPSCWNTRAGGC